MSKPNETSQGIKRTRRSLAKGAILALGAISGLSVGSKKASANWGGWGGWGGGGGCFLRGTRILTPRGYTPIEHLSPGDIVTTEFGGLQPVAKIGSYKIERSDTGAPWSPDTRPVRIKADAFGDGSPSADVWLTASHAVLVDGALVPVGNLVNGATIAFDDAMGPGPVEFFHIELVGHDVVDAEGAACETLRDPACESCAPVLNFNGHLNELKSRLRSAVSPVLDRREPLDVIRDNLEERAAVLARAPAVELRAF